MIFKKRDSGFFGHKFLVDKISVLAKFDVLKSFSYLLFLNILEENRKGRKSDKRFPLYETFTFLTFEVTL